MDIYVKNSLQFRQSVTLPVTSVRVDWLHIWQIVPVQTAHVTESRISSTLEYSNTHGWSHYALHSTPPFHSDTFCQTTSIGLCQPLPGNIISMIVPDVNPIKLVMTGKTLPDIFVAQVRPV